MDKFREKIVSDKYSDIEVSTSDDVSSARTDVGFVRISQGKDMVLLTKEDASVFAGLLISKLPYIEMWRKRNKSEEAK